jgi:hypothetical protein
VSVQESPSVIDSVGPPIDNSMPVN